MTRLYRVSKEEQRQVCQQEKQVGPCRGTFKRWYYDTNSKQCREFFFGGCRGNSNNFIKYEDCDKRCQQRDVGNRNQAKETFQNDQFRNALDVLVKRRRKASANSMNDAFIEIEEQKAVVQKLEMEKQIALDAGEDFDDGGLEAAMKKLMMMERMKDKQVMMSKQRMMAKQRMETEQRQQRMMRSKMRNQDEPVISRNVTLTEDSDWDCEMTSWSPWSLSCSATCGTGYKNRFRRVERPGQGRGRPCPSRLEKQKRCRLPSCPLDDCQHLSQWSVWGPCTATCGSSGHQTRHRDISSCTSQDGLPGIEKRVCLLPCCYIVDGVCRD